MDSELKDAITKLTSELKKLSDEVKELKETNKEISSKLYLTNEYLSTLN
jgi:uncharacterized phage infection (PIP) family protein YhgE